MNPNNRCNTCLHNIDARCTNTASRYHGSPLSAHNTCSQHTAPLPSTAELTARLEHVAAALEHLAARGGADYAEYWGGRALCYLAQPAPAAFG